MRQFTRSIALAALGLVLVVAPRGIAQQISDIAAVQVVVEGEDRLLRCGPNQFYYIVGRLAPGTVLTVDGEDEQWYRAAYPQGVSAMVPGDEARYDDAKKEVTLTADSTLKALNAASPEGGKRTSWRRLLEQPLKAGTTLKVIQTITAKDGSISYAVEAPSTARGYVARSAVREATPAEIEAYRQRLAALKDGEAALPEVQEEDVPERVLAVQEPTIEPEVAAPAASDPASDAVASEEISLLEPMVTEVTEAQTNPTVIDQSGDAVATGEDAEAGEAAAEERPVADFKALAAAYAEVIKVDALDAEYSELISEFERAIDSIEDHDLNKSLIAKLKQHVEALNLKKDIQEQKRTLAEMLAETSESSEELTQRISAFTDEARYTIVGKLVPSTVFDGRRLPRMYRILAVDTIVPTTIGYLKPDEKLNLESKLGRVIGVEGTANLDPSLKLRIVTPKRIDVLPGGDQPAGG